ncbi:MULTISPECIES: diaminopimelate epimerase [Marivita]|uniref:Diaminopimelate epimerase n=1 Tax=Marivita cryptomonadis TaxID=505252 RepID=A0A9Q2PAP9_9RHOB|nr:MULTISPECIES: diaminopimelate epimerase [Marivita]MCR9170786.1 diaminopimelate epimerase [Paracoccaceae bacterium]MBM2321418.1 diaminopimelate epimerase [Marivita cryptomonadis]MBM2330999.1 diaminopimelate epimerase [Marivita cryptomonadis]MBM2340585.1 diaminopimelate epimerase [Marivita cryptomonadis]MBM2345247.1 diaminopimelate epimerase [Marivita cryptomonadis]
MMTHATRDIAFMKMHGLGNDFVVLDARARPVGMTAALAQAIGDRHRGVGFDQLAVIETGDGDADARLIFYNSDGSTAGACGNATRCIARHLMAEAGRPEVVLTTERGRLLARDAGDGLTSVNMGQPQLRWDEVPLAHDMDTLELPIDGAPTATGMGNPHCTFFVENAESVDLEARGSEIEHHPLYPQRTNVQFASVIGPDHLRMRVWERGVGVTLASGSSSCATAVAASRRGLTGRRVSIDLDGGRIEIDWREDGVWMTGPTAHVFSGTFSVDWLEAVS